MQTFLHTEADKEGEGVETFPQLDSKMNIDFIEVCGHFTGKDTPNFAHLQLWSENKASGRLTYYIEGCRKMKILYTPSSGLLVLSGSVMYFIQGHNFTFDKMAFVSAIDYIEALLEVDLWQNCLINIIECGVIVEVSQNPKNYIQNHREGKGMVLFEDPKDKGHFRSFNDSLAKRKMYNAGRNIQQKQGISQKELIKAEGWNPEGYYLKWEVHYIKPEKLLNRGVGIRLCDILSPHWQEVFSADIYNQYKRIISMKSIIQPSEKSNFVAMDIFAIELVEAKLNEGSTIEEVKKMLYDRINASSILSKADKDARKRSIKATLDKLAESDTSTWDISQKLEEALNLASDTPAETEPADKDEIPDPF